MVKRTQLGRRDVAGALRDAFGRDSVAAAVSAWWCSDGAERVGYGENVIFVLS